MSSSPYIFEGPEPDVILRAYLQVGSDEVKDFHVHKLILSIASVVFRDTFSIPQPRSTSSDPATLDVVQVTELPQVIEVFLRLVYPVDPPVIEDLQLLDDLFRFADKYIASGVTNKLKNVLVSPPFLHKDPIGVFAIACRSNLEEEAELAVSRTFSLNLITSVTPVHLQSMTAQTYHRLLTKHAHRREELLGAVEKAANLAAFRSCRCMGKFKKEVQFCIIDTPFLEKEILERCHYSAKFMGLTCNGFCILKNNPDITLFLCEIMRNVQALEP